MISAIGAQNRHIPPVKEEKSGETLSGKSGGSVGHRAKAMTAESDDTAPGAEGRAASMIARMDITVLTPQPASAADGAHLNVDVAEVASEGEIAAEG